LQFPYVKFRALNINCCFAIRQRNEKCVAAAAAAASAVECDVTREESLVRIGLQLTCIGSDDRLSSGGSAEPSIIASRCCCVQRGISEASVPVFAVVDNVYYRLQSIDRSMML